MTETVYISGPMTGYENHNFAAFNAKAEELKRRGFAVTNPADTGIVEDWSWSDYLRLDLRELSHCDVIYMMNGWASSKGARLEHHVAKELGMKVYYESEQA